MTVSRANGGFSKPLDWLVLVVAMAVLPFITEAHARPPGNAAYPPQVAAWTEEEIQRQRASASQLILDIAAAVAAGERRFVVPPGQYRFGPGGAANLLLKGVRDFELDADGATFWLYPFQRVDGVELQDCEDVTIKGLTIDYSPMPCSQGTVTEINAEAGYIEFTVDTGFPLPLEIRSGSVNAKIVHFTEKGSLLASRLDWVRKVSDCGNGRYRVFPKHGWVYKIPGDIRPGTRIALADRAMRMAVNLSNSSHCRLQDITIYATPHMAFTEFLGKGGHVYQGCRVIRRPDTKRLLASNADVFHSVGVEVGPTIEHCEFSFAADDLVNIHGLLGVTLEKAGADQAEIVSQAGKAPGVGEELRFYDRETFALKASAKIVEIGKVDDESRRKAAQDMMAGDRVAFIHPAVVSRVILDRPVDVSRRDYVVSDERVARGTVIRNNNFHDCYTRGILLKCADGRIERNRIDNMGISSIGVALDAHFMEAPSPSDIVISGNLITRNGFCNFVSGTGWNYLIGAISVTNELGSGLPQGPVMENIRISGNTIRNTATIGILLTNVAGGEIVDNTIEGFLDSTAQEFSGVFGGRMKLSEPFHAIVIARSEHIRLERNTIKFPGRRALGAIAFHGNVSAGPQKPDIWRERPLPGKIPPSSSGEKGTP
ncbi:hypothetical protein DB345_04210 [Spartobacteria bacterium LR76]|nr:hypothetical protein DB345_04210 [Spartobacteria bacterium LR76]